MKPRATYRKAGETAASLGVSIKALRIYERHGLVEPERSSAGYRIYGPDQMRRLHQVLALKSLGLSLAQIGDCLVGLGGDLRPILEIQEKDLRLRIAALEKAATAVATARRRLEAGESLSVDDLTTLTKEIVMTEAMPDWRENLVPLFARHFTEAERRTMIPPAPSTPEHDADTAEREALLAEARAQLGRDPSSPEALDLARRWRKRAMTFTRGDRAMLAKLRAVFDDALDDPAIAATLPWRAEMAFIRDATKRLEDAEH